jgi:hypothetical protein
VQVIFAFELVAKPIKANIFINSHPNAPAPTKNVFVFEDDSVNYLPNNTE